MLQQSSKKKNSHHHTRINNLTCYRKRILLFSSLSMLWFETLFNSSRCIYFCIWGIPVKAKTINLKWKWFNIWRKLQLKNGMIFTALYVKKQNYRKKPRKLQGLKKIFYKFESSCSAICAYLFIFSQLALLPWISTNLACF